MKGFRSMALGLAVTAGALFAQPAQAALIDLSTWTVVQYELNSQPNANWVLSNGNHTATQNVNADASFLVSDFNVAGKKIQGSWRVNTTSDDDFMGFGFGIQSRGQFYLFDWKQLDQNDSLGFAQRGMSLKVVNKASGDPTGADLWPTAGSPDVAVLRHNTVVWAEFTDYEFTLIYNPGVIDITVKQGSTTLEHWEVSDSTFLDGGFGFYNYSQSDVVYNGFTEDPAPPPSSSVPAPAALLLLGLGLGGLSLRRLITAR